MGEKTCIYIFFLISLLWGHGKKVHGSPTSPANIQTPPAHCSVFCCSHLAILFLRMLVETSDTHSHSELANRPEDAGEEYNSSRIVGSVNIVIDHPWDHLINITTCKCGRAPYENCKSLHQIILSLISCTGTVLTNLMEQSLSGEGNSCSLSGIACILWNVKFHYHVHKL
jgi:hypothetical protein